MAATERRRLANERRRARPREGARAWALASAGALVGLVACGDERPGETQICSCDYLTDTDLPGKQAVVVCGSVESREGAAAACVRDLGVGHVETCACERGGEPCRPGLCAQR